MDLTLIRAGSTGLPAWRRTGALGHVTSSGRPISLPWQAVTAFILATGNVSGETSWSYPGAIRPARSVPGGRGVGAVWIAAAGLLNSAVHPYHRRRGNGGQPWSLLPCQVSRCP